MSLDNKTELEDAFSSCYGFHNEFGSKKKNFGMHRSKGNILTQGRILEQDGRKGGFPGVTQD